MDVFERGQVGLFVLGFEVDNLAADHAVDSAGGVGDFADDGNARLGWTAQLREHFIGLRLQRVSRQDGDRLAEDFVAGGTAAAQVVVIERGQIVMNRANKCAASRAPRQTCSMPGRAAMSATFAA